MVADPVIGLAVVEGLATAALEEPFVMMEGVDGLSTEMGIKVSSYV